MFYIVNSTFVSKKMWSFAILPLLSVTYSVDESAYTLGIRLTWLFWGIVVYQSIKKGKRADPHGQVPLKCK